MAAGSMVAEAGTSTAAVGLIAAEEEPIVVAALGAAHGLLAEEATTRAADRKPAAIQARHELSRRIFVLPSTMDSGIRSATQAAPRELPRT